MGEKKYRIPQRYRPDELDKAARTKLLAMHADLGTWLGVAQELGYVNTGLVHQVAHGKKRAPNAMLMRLDLDTRGVVAPKRPHYSERDNERITIRLSPYLSARISERAKSQGVSRARWLRECAERACGIVRRE